MRNNHALVILLESIISTSLLRHIKKKEAGKELAYR